MIDVIVLPFLRKRFISEFVFYIGIVELCDYAQCRINTYGGPGAVRKMRPLALYIFSRKEVYFIKIMV